MKTLARCLVLATLLAGAGCSVVKQPSFDAPAVYRGPLPTIETADRVAPVSEGSLYSESAAADLVGDFRARHVGDVLIVRISESSTGVSKADSKLDKNSNNSLEAPTPLGFATALKGKIGKDFDPALAYSTTNNQSFDGKGQTTRANTLNAFIAVRVMAIGAGGRMVVAGAKHVAVNQERQNLTLAGIVRPEDVAADNTVSSAMVADLVINYGGTGDLNQVTKQGWFTKLLSKVWPF